MKARPGVYILFFLFFFNMAYSQNQYWVGFLDKDDTPFNIHNPGDFLSRKAIERRVRQGILIDESDLPVNPSYTSKVSQTGVQLKYASKWLNGLVIATDDSTQLNTIMGFPFVKSIVPINKYKTTPSVLSKYATETFIPEESEGTSGFAKTSGYNYGNSYNQVNMLSGDVLHNSGLSGEGITMAVLDAGFYKVNTLPAFDSVRTNKQIIGTWDYVMGNSGVYEDDPHGMIAFSGIAGYLPGQLVGTAPKATFFLLRTEEASKEYIGEEYNWVAAAEFADSAGVDIISSSLGYNTFDNTADNHKYSDLNGDKTPITIAADKAAKKGILVIVSAGNEGTDSWKYIIAPADGDSVMAVAAVDESGIRAGFSSVGPSADKRVKPNLAAQGKNTVLAAAGGGTALVNGTSYACPLIAGLAACLWQGKSSYTNMDIFRAIEQSCNHYNLPDSLTGYGIPNFGKANIFLSVQQDKMDSDVKMQILSNPFNDILNLALAAPGATCAYINVYNVSGQLVINYKQEINPNHVNNVYIQGANQLPSGLYYVRAIVNNGQVTVKALKRQE